MDREAWHAGVHGVGDAHSSSVPFSCLQSFPASGSFQMSQFFARGCQSIGVPVQPKNKSKQKLENFKLKFNISPSSEYSGLISFRMEWFDLFAVQGTLESSQTPQFKSINSSALSFIVQLSHPYMTTGKTIALTRWTLVRI